MRRVLALVRALWPLTGRRRWWREPLYVFKNINFFIAWCFSAFKVNDTNLFKKVSIFEVLDKKPNFIWASLRKVWPTRTFLKDIFFLTRFFRKVNLNNGLLLYLTWENVPNILGVITIFVFCSIWFGPPVFLYGAQTESAPARANPKILSFCIKAGFCWVKQKNCNLLRKRL